MAEMDDDELLAALEVEIVPLKTSNRTPREERIIAGFEDILRFRETHGRAQDMVKMATSLNDCMRFDWIKSDAYLPEAATMLSGMDTYGLLSNSKPITDVDTLDEDAYLMNLG
ncbi:MAG: hypothetical protein V9E91_09050 [Burkholderiaceae bacterium]